MSLPKSRLLDLLRRLWSTQGKPASVTAAHYDALAAAVGDLVLHHDARGEVLACSPNAPNSFSIDTRKVLGRGFFHRIHVADRPNFLQAFSAALRGDGSASATVRLISAASRFDPAAAGFAWAEVRLRRVHGEAESSDARAAVVSLTRNLTDAKEIERKLEAAQAEAVKAISLKDRLLANVSHELRTPLNAILGFSEILGDPNLTPVDPDKQREYARIIHSSAEHLLSVVNLVLDMSKIEAGKFDISPEPFALGPLVKSCADMLRLKIEAGGVTLECEAMEGLPELVADKRACRQILLNLMSNAVKFTPPGGHVWVRACVSGDRLDLSVADTGIGIGPDDLPKLGHPFFQVRNNYDRTFEGAGLGLSLVRGLVGLHGGSLRLESAPGAGTNVTVRLPMDCRHSSSAGAGVTRFETIAIPPATKTPAADLVIAEKRFA